MIFYFSSSDDFEIVTELVEDAGYREQHQRYIDPELGEIEVVPNPCFITNHDDDIGEEDECNGTPEKGETIALQINVLNQGNNPADDVVANLKSNEEEGILITAGRESLGSIPPGKNNQTTLNFQIASNFSKDKLSLGLSLLDKTTRERLDDTFSIPLSQKDILQLDPPQQQVQIPPHIEIISKEISPDSRQLKITGLVADDKALSDIIIYAGTEKVFYQAVNQGSESNKMNFSAKIPLKDGANAITIEARDNRHIISDTSLIALGPDKLEGNSK